MGVVTALGAAEALRGASVIATSVDAAARDAGRSSSPSVGGANRARPA